MSANFSYHLDGQIAGVTYADGRRENYLWDGLALIHRDGTELLNEPAVTGGNPVLSGDKVLFNDMLGNTLGVKDQDSYHPIKMTAFGESENVDAFFTGKPLVGVLGYAFLFRNYRPGQGKWQTADPLGYPDGWNNFAYVNNGVTESIDWLGGNVTYIWSGWSVQRTIGLGAQNFGTGVQIGYSVTVLWVGTISWSCDTCEQSGIETYYGRTTYSIDPQSYAPLWTAPSVNVKAYPAGELIDILGITNDVIDTVLDLADQKIAANLQASTVDGKAYSNKPTRPANPTHVCE